MDGTVKFAAFLQCPHDLESAALVAAKWQSVQVWSVSFEIARKSCEAYRIGTEESRKADADDRAGYFGEADRRRQEMNSAFSTSERCEAVIDRRHKELAVLRSSLRTLAPELMTLVPLVDFWGDQPADLTQFAERMVELESKLLMKASAGNGEDQGGGETGDTDQRPQKKLSLQDVEKMMMLEFIADPDAAFARTQREWARYCGCGTGTIANSRYWKKRQAIRLALKEEFSESQRQEALNDIEFEPEP